MSLPPPPPVLVIGTSSGIGLAVVDALLARGDRVIGLSRSPSPRAGRLLEPGPDGTWTVGAEFGAWSDEASSDAVSSVARAGEDGGKAPAPPADHHHIIIDVTSDAFRPTLATLLDQEPGIRTVIHCAGVGSGFDPDDFSGELRCFRTNLHSVVELCAEVMPRWRSAGGGHLVVLSSLADGFVAPGSPSYVASKIALSRYLRGLGLRLRRDGISVTNVRFGFVDTKMAKARWKPLQWTTERAARTVLQVLRRPVPVRSRPRTIALLCLGGEWLQRLILGLEALFAGRRSPGRRPGGPRSPGAS